MDVHLTAVFRKANLEEAAALVLETNRALLEGDLKGAEVIREPFTVTR